MYVRHIVYQCIRSCVWHCLIQTLDKIGDFSDFQKGQIVGGCFAGAFVTNCLFGNSFYDHDCVHKAWQYFISVGE